MKKLLLFMLLMAATVAAEETYAFSDAATGTSNGQPFRGWTPEPPKYLIIQGPKGPVAELSLETGRASYSADIGTATRIFWDAIEQEWRVRQPVKIEFRPDCNTGFYHDGTRWRLVWRGRVIW